jgi:transcriptional regulator with XRE-family HTH domain
MTNATDEIPSSFSDKVLAAAAAAGQDTSTTQQDVNREGPDVRLRFGGRRSKPTKSKDTGRDDLRAFADALDALMKRAGVKPADLARMVWGTTVDSRGYTVPRNRDRIGSYLSAQSYPEPENLQKLADALGVPVEELASTRPPAPERPEVPRQNPPRRATSESNLGELVLTAIPAKPGRTILRVHRELSWKLAAHIHGLIREAEDAEIRGALNEDPVINPDVGKIVVNNEHNSNHAS